MDRPNLHAVDGGPAVGAEEPTDDELMLLARTNHADAFEVLVRRHQKLVLGLATRFLGNASLGRDVAQDVFLAVWAERGQYQAHNRFRSYLVAVTLHRCQFVARQARCHERRLGDLASEPTTAPPNNGAMQALIEVERRREVREKLARLPDTMREVLILRFTHDLPLEEISALTGLREGTVKSHLFRGIRRLHRWLEKGGS